MPLITVYYGDSFHYSAELKPEIWEASQREVTEAELFRLREMKAQYEEYQSFLADLHVRPDIDGVARHYETGDTK